MRIFHADAVLLVQQQNGISERIKGLVIGALENFIVAAEFLGYGLQHAPAISLSLCELILAGTYESGDLSLFSYHRKIDKKLLPELGPYLKPIWHMLIGDSC